MSFNSHTASGRVGPRASSPLRRFTLSCLLSVIGVTSAQATVYNFTYVGSGDYVGEVGGVWGYGSFTTGPAYQDGYMPITGISGTTEAGTITGLVTSGGASTDPNNGGYLYCCAIDYDNAFYPAGMATGSPFSGTGGPLFNVSLLVASPINLFSDGTGNTYEFSYGEDTPNYNIASFGGTLIDFTATEQPAPEPGFYGELALGLGGLLVAGWRRQRIS